MFTLKVLLFCLFVNIVNLNATIYAYKLGVLEHSTGPVSSGIESGYDINAELLFDTELLDANLALGADVNLQGDTSFLYSGLSWEGDVSDFLAWELFFGLAMHDGELAEGSVDRRQLGSRFVFREAVALGFAVSDDMTLTVIYDHYSHIGIEDRPNQGNDNIGVRLSIYVD